jgi:hypothetical protein
VRIPNSEGGRDHDRRRGRCRGAIALVRIRRSDLLGDRGDLIMCQEVGPVDYAVGPSKESQFARPHQIAAAGMEMSWEDCVDVRHLGRGPITRDPKPSAETGRLRLSSLAVLFSQCSKRCEYSIRKRVVSDSHHPAWRYFPFHDQPYNARDGISVSPCASSRWGSSHSKMLGEVEC